MKSLLEEVSRLVYLSGLKKGDSASLWAWGLFVWSKEKQVERREARSGLEAKSLSDCSGWFAMKWSKGETFSEAINFITACSWTSWYGSKPVANYSKTQPKAQMSAFMLIMPATYSGLIYLSVPPIRSFPAVYLLSSPPPGVAMAFESTILETPKSMILTLWAFLLKTIFYGLISWCAILCSWRYSIPVISCLPMLLTWSIWNACSFCCIYLLIFQPSDSIIKWNSWSPVFSSYFLMKYLYLTMLGWSNRFPSLNSW